MKIEIKRDEKGPLSVTVGGHVLPTGYVGERPNGDGTLELLPAFEGYEVRHRPGDGEFEVDLTLNAPLAEFCPGGKGKPLTVHGIEFPSAFRYAVRHITQDVAKITLTVIAEQFVADVCTGWTVRTSAQAQG